MSKIDHTLFDAPTEHAEQCPQCGAELVIKHSKHGGFLGCSQYPSCHYMRPFHERDSSIIKTLDVACPECHSALAVKNGRYGMFIGCTSFPDCHFIVHDEPEQPLDISCPECNKGTLTERHSRKGTVFFGCNRYPKCDFALNDSPVAAVCPICHYSVAIRKPSFKVQQVQCANKSCGHKYMLDK